jgi:hypothetical protein
VDACLYIAVSNLLSTISMRAAGSAASGQEGERGRREKVKIIVHCKLGSPFYKHMLGFFQIYPSYIQGSKH